MLAAHCAPHVFVQDLVVLAALQADRERVYRAAVLDRHAASVLTDANSGLALEEIRSSPRVWPIMTYILLSAFVQAKPIYFFRLFCWCNRRGIVF
jgi:hypothetical protein